MDDLSIGELDEAYVRALGIVCALQSFMRQDVGFTPDELILFAMQIEDFICDGGTIEVSITDGSIKSAIR